MNNKIVLLADTHFGVNKSSDIFINSQKIFFKEEFIPYLQKNKIEKVFILGDLFHNRNNINIKVQNFVVELFRNDLKDYEIIIITGNHDIYYNTTLQTNSLEWLREFKNVTLINEMQEMEVYEKKILLCPWQVDTDLFIKQINENNYKANICFGHLNLNGFFFNKSKVSENGISPSLFFDNFNLTFTGHFHIRNQKKSKGSEIVYVGSPYHLTRHDKNEDKGFVLLDVNTLKYEYVNASKTMKFIDIEYPNKFTEEEIENNIVDVTINYDNDYNEYKVQQYIKKLETYNPARSPTINIINNLISEIDMSEIEITSSEDLIREYISMNDELKNKDEVYRKIEELHEQCRKDI